MISGRSEAACTSCGVNEESVCQPWNSLMRTSGSLAAVVPRRGAKVTSCLVLPSLSTLPPPLGSIDRPAFFSPRKVKIGSGCTSPKQDMSRFWPSAPTCWPVSTTTLCFHSASRSCSTTSSPMTSARRSSPSNRAPIVEVSGVTVMSLPMGSRSSQVALCQHRLVHLLGGPRPHDAAAHQHVDVVGHLQCAVDVLLHDQQPHPRLVELLQRLVDLVDDDRRQPHGELVGEDQLG